MLHFDILKVAYLGGCCLAGCQLVAKTQSFQLVCIWLGSLIPRMSVCLRFDVLLRLDAVFCEISKRTMKPSVAYVAKSA